MMAFKCALWYDLLMLRFAGSVFVDRPHYVSGRAIAVRHGFLRRFLLVMKG